MGTPKISVIMSVYNTREDWLREAVESILNQTYTDFEFIIINDGSENNAEDVILSYKDDRIVYVKQENQGLPNSLNRGFDIAKAEYIARMDSDDISLPERFEKQVKYLDEHPEISVLGTWIERFPKIKLIKNPPFPKYLDFLNSCCIAHPTIMLRKSDFDKYDLRYNPDAKCEDYELWSRAVKYLHFANLQEVLLKYRWHGSNMSKSSDSSKKFIGQVQKNMLDFLTDNEKLRENLVDNADKYLTKDCKFLEKIFSVKNSRDGAYKKFVLLGIRFKIKFSHK